MSRRTRRHSFIGAYRTFFLSERTVACAAVLAIAMMPLIWYFGASSGTFDMADVFDLTTRTLLVVTLLHPIRHHKLLLMQAATVGLLFCMLCAQSQYALGDLAHVDSETYIKMGLQGFVFLAVERMILFVQSLFAVNHFSTHIERRRGATRLFVNRAAILFLLALVTVQLIIAPFLSFEWSYVLHVWILHLDELLVFNLFMSAELIMLVDGRELFEDGEGA